MVLSKKDVKKRCKSGKTLHVGQVLGFLQKKSRSESPRNIKITHFSLSFRVMASVVALYLTNLMSFYNNLAYILVDNIDGTLSITLGPLRKEYVVELPTDRTFCLPRNVVINKPCSRRPFDALYTFLGN